MTTLQITSRFSAGELGSSPDRSSDRHDAGRSKNIGPQPRQPGSRLRWPRWRKDSARTPAVITSSQEDHAEGPVSRLRSPRSCQKRTPGTGQVVPAWSTLGPIPIFRGAVPATGRKNLIMAGGRPPTFALFSRLIDAALDGFAVQAVMDASARPAICPKEFSRQRMHDAGVVLTATNTLIAEIAQDWSTPAGQQLIGLLFSDVFFRPLAPASHRPQITSC